MNTLQYRRYPWGGFDNKGTGDGKSGKDGEKKKGANPFTLFLILILLILSDLGAMSLILNIIRNHYIRD